MTRKEAEYLNRLHDRRIALEKQLDRTSERATFYVDIKKELNALRWAIGIIETIFSTSSTAGAGGSNVTGTS